MRAEDYPVAIAEYKRLIAANPGTLEHQIALGETYSQAGDTRNALDTLQKARDAAPRSPIRCAPGEPRLSVPGRNRKRSPFTAN